MVNSPLLDFRKLATADQLQRLADNKVTVDEFDIEYLRRHLARPGYGALQSLKASYAKTHPNLVIRINALYAENQQPSSTKAEFIAGIKFLTGNPPESLLTTLYEKESTDRWNLQKTQQYYLRAVDVDQDGNLEYLWIKQRDNWTIVTLYYREAPHWKALSLQTEWNRKDNADGFYQSLSDGDIAIEPSEWNDIIIGGRRFRVGFEE